MDFQVVADEIDGKAKDHDIAGIFAQRYGSFIEDLVCLAGAFVWTLIPQIPSLCKNTRLNINDKLLLIEWTEYYNTEVRYAIPSTIKLRRRFQA